MESARTLKCAFFSYLQEVAFSHPDAKKTDCNHIFQNFVSTVSMDPRKIAEHVQDMILHRYASRLMKLKVRRVHM